MSPFMNYHNAPLHKQVLASGTPFVKGLPNKPSLWKSPSGEIAYGSKPPDAERSDAVTPGQMAGFGQRFGQAMESPIMGFGLRLLANSGPSLYPTSFGQALGRAGLGAIQDQHRQSFDRLQRALIEAQIGAMTRRNQPTESSGIGNVDPSKYTPASLQSFAESRNFGDLVPVEGDGADLNKIANELADDARAESRDFVVQRDAYRRIESAAQNPSAFGDLSLIFGFMKVQDPGSTVREGEFANAQNSGGVSTRIRNLYNQVLDGTRLTPGQRDDLLRTSQRIFNASAKGQLERNQRFTQRGVNAGLPEAFISPLLISADSVDVLPETPQRSITDIENEIAEIDRQLEALDD